MELEKKSFLRMHSTEHDQKRQKNEQEPTCPVNKAKKGGCVALLD